MFQQQPSHRKGSTGMVSSDLPTNQQQHMLVKASNSTNVMSSGYSLPLTHHSQSLPKQYQNQQQLQIHHQNHQPQHQYQKTQSHHVHLSHHPQKPLKQAQQGHRSAHHRAAASGVQTARPENPPTPLRSNISDEFETETDCGLNKIGDKPKQSHFKKHFGKFGPSGSEDLTDIDMDDINTLEESLDFSSSEEGDDVLQGGYADPSPSPANSVAYTAYSMGQSMGHSMNRINEDGDNDIVHGLRDVGVNVIEIQSTDSQSNPITEMNLYLHVDQVVNGGEVNNLFKDIPTEIGSDVEEQFGMGMNMARVNPWEPRCLLYTDSLGRVFNVVVSGGTKGLIMAWYQACVSFAGWRAIVALPFLIRVVAACFGDEDVESSAMASITGLAPGLVALVVGLVLVPETSYSSLASALYMRGVPSVAAYVWTSSPDLSDFPRSLALLALLLSMFAPLGNLTRKILLLTGTFLVVTAISANLGSRAWKKMGRGYICMRSSDSDRKCFQTNITGGIRAYFAAVLTGLVLPYIGMNSVNYGRGGHLDIDVGKGDTPRRQVAFASMVTACVYILTDTDAVQGALGFHFQHTFLLNIVIGAWWILSTILSLLVCHRLESNTKPSAEKSGRTRLEPFLKRDQMSPVGWCVPSIPNLVIDPTYKVSNGLFCHRYTVASDILIVIAVGITSFLFYWNGLRQGDGYSFSLW